MAHVTRNDIDSFMKDISVVLSEKSACDSCQSCADEGCNNSNVIYKKETLLENIEDQQGTTRTNVVYLNTNCNLRCEYCYEGDSRNGLPDQANCTEEMLDSFLYEIREREGDLNSCIVVMGGEPLLKFDLYEYLVRKAASIPKSGGWAIPITTNTLLFLDERLISQYKELKDFAENNNVFVSIEVSYDGSGHYRRKFPNGKSSRKYVEKAINNLIKNDIFFSISYTVHSGNYKNVIEDMVKICELWPECDKVSLSFAYEDLDSVGTSGYAEILRKEYRPYLEYIYSLYNIPFCTFTCADCGRCDKSTNVGNAYLSPTTGITYADKMTQRKFSQF